MIPTPARACMAVLFPLLAVACGASSGAGAGVLPAICPQPVGGYVITADRTQGDCGFNAHIEKLSLLAAGAEPGCSVADSRATPAPYGCNYEETQICPRGSATFTVVSSFAVPRNPADFSGTSTYQIEDAPGHRCVATYTVRMRKAGVP